MCAKAQPSLAAHTSANEKKKKKTNKQFKTNLICAHLTKSIRNCVFQGMEIPWITKKNVSG